MRPSRDKQEKQLDSYVLCIPSTPADYICLLYHASGKREIRQMYLCFILMANKKWAINPLYAGGSHEHSAVGLFYVRSNRFRYESFIIYVIMLL